MQVGFTNVSSNRKTGPIPTTTTEKSSCPDTCPFKEKGCYAKGGPQNIHWSAISRHERGYKWDEFLGLIRKINRGQLWRHNVSGDLPHSEGVINRDEVIDLVNANRGRRGYTYTHHVLNNENIAILQEANNNGFTVNASCESVDVADDVMSTHNIPAVAVVPSTESRRFFTTTNGRKVIVCPATLHDNVSCSTCGICANANRSAVVAFPAHGNAKKTVDGIVTEG